MACSPDYNWREARLTEAKAKLLLPCKPDTGSRQLMLAGQSVKIEMAGCEAGGAMFVFAHTEMTDAEQANSGVHDWENFMRKNMQTSEDGKFVPYEIKYQLTKLQGIRYMAMGKNEVQQNIEVQAMWVTRGADLYHALTYSKKLNQEAVENFLSGIELE